MNFTEKLQSDLKKAMLSKDADTVRTLRMLISKLREKKIALIKDLDEAEELAVLKKAAKERLDSIQTYTQAGRRDLAEIEQAELELIRTYLPAEMEDAAIEAIVKKIIAETGVTSPADKGRVMGPAMKAVAGKADGKRVQAVVTKLLGG
ncbi:MAG: GatB/YqeY domain-containing protein [Candidatus Marinimicrobia bacterium]|nr:GatB/YqeY domain-containing protein [Candidatus Neomarinimicrobiota bacterium]